MRNRVAVQSLLILTAAPAFASSPAAWSAGDSAARNACVKESQLTGAAASAPVHFSDRSAQDVLLVTGRFAQKALKGKPASMICLYDRRTKKAEVQEASAWSKPGGH